MKIRPMVIDEVGTQKLAHLKAYAEKHPYSMDDLLDLINNKGRVAGDDPNFKCFLPIGYCIVFSIEEQNPGKVRHLSMSVNEAECLPGIPSVKLIMELLGFKNPLEKCLVKIEDIRDAQLYIQEGRHAINVLELIK